MNEEMYHLMVPRRLDDSAKFLLWDFDVAVIFLGLLMFGIMAGFFLSSAVIALACAYGVQKLKQGQQKGYSMHLLYWYMPIRFFRRTPPSDLRDFIG